MRHRALFRFRLVSSALGALALCASLLSMSGCGASRTAAATQKTPAAFDPSASDEKALTTIDEMLAALGGADKWAQVKQVRWEIKYMASGDLKSWSKHAWDIWNGRHRYEVAKSDTLSAAKAANDMNAVVFVVAMYDLFDHKGKGYVTESSNPGRAAMSEDRDRIVAEAYTHWQKDSYQLAMFYKLRDPGVKLQYVGERSDLPGVCQPACIDIKVAFVPEVGNDVYHVYLNKETKLPEAVELNMAGGGMIVFGISEWQDVGGMKFPKALRNLGPDEKFVIENIQISEPEDELYVPQVLG